MSDQTKDNTPRKSDTYPDSAATKVLDQYLFRYKHMECQESTNPLVERLFGDLAVLCENVIDADRKYREDWQSQGRKLTPEFIRETRRAVLYTLSQQKEAIQKNLNLSALIWAGVMASIPAKELLEKEMKLLERELANAYASDRDGAMTSLPVTTAPSTPTRVLLRNSPQAQQDAERRIGRPRKDGERELVRKKKQENKSWKQIAAEMNRETGQDKSVEAYRALLRTGSGRHRSRKNGQE